METQKPFDVLVFSKTCGYRHDSIPAGVASLQCLAEQTSQFIVTASEDASTFTFDNLSNYAVIILLQTIGDIFTQDQLDALKQFVRDGGGVVAIHGAAAGMPNDAWYENLIGAHFDQHPPHEPGIVLVEDMNQDHFIMNCCGGRESWTDEFYNFTSHPRGNSNLKVLLRGDPKSFEGGKHGDDHPLAWCQEFEGGRVFFTALGHFDEAYSDEWFIEQMKRGILWAARKDNKG
ncbi:glycosyl hydrolase [Paraphaeosphaeria sporulosa]|uniref:Glycosyl hydrolase n=1 Tax=Paraphaeosphaeria sporulosa TaxID=1460663 RepID=A0A177CGA3_9PLEO|nr:glycosyl hydrolase [Paraphaeosphaeria sporulosa]OAG05727.1 glycosyl hydrolase [Paraphaeosphaeria sporulosa]